MKEPATSRPMKLHTKITLAICAVLVAVFAVIAYFSDLTTTRLSEQQEDEEALLLATRLADTIEHHLKRERQINNRLPSQEEDTSTGWREVEDAINETITNNYPEIALIQVFQKNGAQNWQEMLHLQPVASVPLLESEKIQRYVRDPVISGKREQGNNRFVGAIAPILLVRDNQSPAQYATVSVMLGFDENETYAARLRALMWPLMLLAIAAITLITYFLFKHLVYRPLDSLLAAMSKAEAGDLSIEVKPETPDEIGLLTAQYNRMLSRIREINQQLGFEQRELEHRVREATAEIAERKEQLEDTNLRLFQMQRQLTQLERLAAAGQLAAQFAHEVGTPLNLISGHVQLLRARTSDERTIKRLDVIETQIERITRIVRSMLDSTRRPGLKLVSTDVNALLAEILEASQPTLASRSVELRLELSEQILYVKADPDQMQQVFINLINNSLDAMPRGGVLSVKTIGDERQAVIELSDTGEGIPEENINLIFDPLFSTKQGRGAGLGLTIVKQIITEHGGTISVSAADLPGARFRIHLPVDESYDQLARAAGAVDLRARFGDGESSASQAEERE